MLLPDGGGAVFCADVGGSFVKFARSPEPGRLVRLEEVPTPAASFEALADVLDGLLRRHGAGSGDPLALSIAGLVDADGGPALAANIPGINGRRLERDLAERLARPVRAANDADCFALAEALEGAGRGHRVVFALILGTGVGGGLVADGRLVRGAGGVSGEWGHGPVLKTEVSVGSGTLRIPRFPCGCGQVGCVDTVGSARGLERIDRFVNETVRDSRRIVHDWEAGEAGAARTVEAWLDLVADPLALAANLTGASLMPVGGGLGSATALVAALDRTVRERVLRAPPHPLVVPALFGGEGGLAGAAVLGRQR